ncbi:MAG TPA: NAD(P)/FAD-dependent oxidoreductase [Anaerolineaceae bacterium]|nr:NAD(P)/FAD-dependent oxidoreductase [Anaerolineaceae bacterium]HPN50453.1 NAD(P)/FAD-dependent oxidoreductase [Anaerolineaceae bacterium]
MSEKTILIIGGGIAGLSAGCYGRMNGYQTKIFELHSISGGLCTGWKRKGYTIDGCIHWLVGSRPGSGMHALWDELGVLNGVKIVNHEEFVRVRGTDGREFIVYTNVDRLEAHMLALSPQDAVQIKTLTGAIRKFSKFDPMQDNSSPLSGIKMLFTMLPFLGLFKKFGSLTVSEFAGGFKDPLLRQGLVDILGFPGFSLLGLIMTLAWMHAENAGYPIGGSLPFAHAFERRYRELGGEIEFNTRVEKILVENGQAVGLRLADGREVRGDRIISAADGHATLYSMLDGQYLTDELKEMYTTWPIFDPLIQVSLGVNRDLSAAPHAINVHLKKPVHIAGVERDVLSYKHYAYDPTLAPAGKTVVEVMLSSSYAYWKELAEDRERYDAAKQQVALQVIEQLEAVLPGISGQIEMVDVATPLTYERFTGNWQGSFEGWQYTKEAMSRTMQGKSISKTLPGLENFYMIGQWTEPGGGLPPALTSARAIISQICKKDKRAFVSKKTQ